MKFIFKHLVVFLVLFSLLGSLNPLFHSSIMVISPVSGVNDQGTFNSVNITNVEYDTSSFQRLPSIVIGDGEASEIWSDVQQYSNPSYGTNGMVQSAYGESTIYFLLTYDSNLNWIAVQWDSDFTGENAIPMEANDDMWVMGQTEFTTISGDGYSAGQGIQPYIYQDNQNDIQFEIIDRSDEGIMQVEVMRALSTGDSDGRDIQFEASTEFTVMYASNQFHGIDGDIVKHSFSLSSQKLGDEPVTQGPSPSVDKPVFYVKYFNLTLLLTIGFLVLVLLPVTMVQRRLL